MKPINVKVSDTEVNGYGWLGLGLLVFVAVTIIFLGGVQLGRVTAAPTAVQTAIMVKQQEDQQAAEAKQAAAQAKRDAEAQEREEEVLTSEKLDEFLAGAEKQGEGLATIPFVVGDSVELNSQGVIDWLFFQQEAKIMESDQATLLERFQRKWKVRVVSHYLEDDHLVVNYLPSE